MIFRVDKPPLPGIRIPNDPGTWKDGDDLITRSRSGCVTKSFGYFSQAQITARKRAAECFVAHWNAELTRLGLNKGLRE